jgi:Mlc titration factor MtfA (ptsG expression regulator)
VASWPHPQMSQMMDTDASLSYGPLWLLLGLGTLLIAWFVGQPRVADWLRTRRQAEPFPAAWRRILRHRVPLMQRMPVDLQLQLKKHIQVFLAEKDFVGCQGQAITDDVRVTIAAQACLLLLNRPTDYFPRLRQILVYPSAFTVAHDEVDDAGVVHQRHDARVGESWDQGQVILSWDDVRRGAAVAHDGWNVVIHEFAHQLDAEKGRTNGAPELHSARQYKQWSQVMQRHFDALQAAVDRGEHTFLDPYAASAPAEFFAVLSESFFEQPVGLKQAHPELYAELKAFYKVDPAQW